MCTCTVQNGISRIVLALARAFPKVSKADKNPVPIWTPNQPYHCAADIQKILCPHKHHTIMTPPIPVPALKEGNGIIDTLAQYTTSNKY